MRFVPDVKTVGKQCQGIFVDSALEEENWTQIKNCNQTSLKLVYFTYLRRLVIVHIHPVVS